MDIAVFTSSELPTVFRALRSAGGAGPVTAEAASFLDAYRGITGYAGPIDALDPIEPRAVAALVRDRHARRRLVQLAGVAALVARPVRADAAAWVRSLAQALATREPVVQVLDALSRGRRFRARMLTMRRTFRMIMKEAYASEGLL
jgi:hypothetical protein